MSYKAIIIDLDGTAVDSPAQKTPSSRLVEAATSLQDVGIQICAATGRGEKYAWDVLGALHLRSPSIVSGGSRIVDAERRELWRSGLSKQQVSAICDTLLKFHYSAVWDDYVEDAYLSGGWSVEELRKQGDAYLIEAIYVPKADADKVIEALNENVPDIAVVKVTALRPGTNDLHITHRTATKEHAIYELEKILGIDKADMIGVGDGPNDTHLFTAVGYKVAMDNAVDELKEKADEVIGSIQEDGLAEYFERLTKEREDEI